MKTTTPTPPAHCTFDPEDWLRLARCWHPVARACDIAGAPVKATLLDEQLVIYRIKGQVVVARDVCPHRGVPLTLGFHEEEGIVCPLWPAFWRGWPLQPYPLQSGATLFRPNCISPASPWRSATG